MKLRHILICAALAVAIVPTAKASDIVVTASTASSVSPTPPGVPSRPVSRTTSRRLSRTATSPCILP